MKHICLQCEKEFEGRSSRKFCSQTCSASYNNIGIRRHGTGDKLVCPKCGNKKSYQGKMCSSCYQITTTILFGKKKLKEVIRDSSKYKCEQVRQHAHRVMRDFSNKKKICEVCGYKIYIELCHIKPIVDFDLNDLLEEINSLDNLLWLCPNHHKEQELGLLELVA